MSDIKLFQIKINSVKELEGKSVQVEKSLQSLIEKNLETFLGVKFLASEYSTGQKHAGRIDTLGIDENNCPVIIEYKRATNENVINQGLFYLDWLLDHKAEFQLLVQKSLGSKISEAIEWSSARTICIAGDYTKYDSYAVDQINRNIELYRYKKFNDILLLELINSISVNSKPEKQIKDKYEPKRYSTVSELLEKSSKEIKDLFHIVKDYLMALGDEIQFKELMYYFAFKRIKTFASIEIHPKSNNIIIYVYIDAAAIKLEKGFTRDVSKIGHLGVGNIEIRINNIDDFEKAKPLIIKSYERS
ncbi:MAG: DUF91 domain-containing protein [Ignavibacteriae bacterium]|nr:DUF91 domain-containing protein [Ignavibacteriota bacterium]